MKKMFQDKHVKECVPDTQIYTDCTPIISARSLSSSFCHECVIENYSTLKEKKYYSMTDDEFPQRTLKLYKRKTSHNFQFHCELTNSDIQKMSDWGLCNKMKCYVAYDEDEAICPGNLTETNYGFSIEVSVEVITDPRNRYLYDNDKFVIQFRYGNKFYSRDDICRHGTTSKKDEERLSNDLLSLYQSEKFKDFTLMGMDGKDHRVHKAICRSRSEYFYNVDEENMDKVLVEGKFSHVELVIRYMYGGILPQLSVDDLLKVIEVVEDLDVPHLRTSIQQALLNGLNKDNAMKIRSECMKYPNMHMVAAAAEELLV